MTTNTNQDKPRHTRTHIRNAKDYIIYKTVQAIAKSAQELTISSGEFSIIAMDTIAAEDEWVVSLKATGTFIKI